MRPAPHLKASCHCTVPNSARPHNCSINVRSVVEDTPCLLTTPSEPAPDKTPQRDGATMPSEQMLSSARHSEGTAGKKGHRRGQSDASTRYPGDVPPDSDGSLTLPRNTRGPGAELCNLPPPPNTRGPDISSLLQPLEDAIRLQFIPSITGRDSISDNERGPFALLAHLGGLALPNPTLSTPSPPSLTVNLCTLARNSFCLVPAQKAVNLFQKTIGYRRAVLPGTFRVGESPPLAKVLLL